MMSFLCCNQEMVATCSFVPVSRRFFFMLVAVSPMCCLYRCETEAHFQNKD